MAGKYGVDELLKVAVSAGNVGEGVEKIIGALKSSSIFGKLKVVSVLLSVVGDAQVVASANLDEIKKEASELDDDDKSKFVSGFNSSFDLENDEVEGAVEEIVDGVVLAATVAGPVIDVLKEQYPKLMAIILKVAQIFKKQ